MTLSMSPASVPPVIRSLTNLRALLESEVDLTGRVTNVHADDMTTGVCSDKFFLEADSGPLPLRLHAADMPDRPGVVHDGRGACPQTGDVAEEHAAEDVGSQKELPQQIIIRGVWVEA